MNAVIAELELAERAENEAVTKAAKLRVEASKVKRELAEKQAVLDDFRVRSPLLSGSLEPSHSSVRV